MDSSDYTHLVGRVGTQPEKKTTPSGKTLKEFRLAVDGPYDPETKSRETEWYTVSVWEPLDKVVTFGKGGRVWVAGKTSVWHGETGDRKQINAKEIGVVEKLIPGYSAEKSDPDMPEDADGEW
jgi:single-strand DNA-binding protein